MKLARTDVVPVLAIIAGSAVGVISSSLAVWARSASAPSLVPPASTIDASALPPLVYIDGVRIRNDPGMPSLEGWLRGERAFTRSAVRSALVQWLEMTGTSPLVIDGVQDIEVVRGEEAVSLFGNEASGGVILITLERAGPVPAPPAARDISAAPMPTPYTVPPRILNLGEVRRAMFAAFPTSVRDGGVGGTATVHFFIDENGEVRDTRIEQTSGHDVVDDAALNVASVFRFSPALNGHEPVPVWVSHAMTFEVR